MHAFANEPHFQVSEYVGRTFNYSFTALKTKRHLYMQTTLRYAHYSTDSRYSSRAERHQYHVFIDWRARPFVYRCTNQRIGSWWRRLSGGRTIGNTGSPVLSGRLCTLLFCLRPCHHYHHHQQYCSLLEQCTQNEGFTLSALYLVYHRAAPYHFKITHNTTYDTYTHTHTLHTCTSKKKKDRFDILLHEYLRRTEYYTRK